MSDPMTPERLAELREAAEKATSGTWEPAAHYHGQRGCRCGSCDVCTGWVVTRDRLCDETPDANECTGGGCLVPVLALEEATLAAAAPELLAEVERLHPMEAALARQVDATEAATRKVETLYREVDRLRPMETALAAVRELLNPDADFYDGRHFEPYTAQFIRESVLAIIDGEPTRAALDGGGS